MSEAVAGQATAFVEPLGKPNSGKAAVPASRLRWGRIAKIGSAGGLLAAAASALLVQQSQVTTDNAVVSAYVRSIRAPIQGQVSGLHLHVGDGVTGTSLLAHVLNDRVNDEHLVDLRGELARSKADLAALEDQRKALTALRATLIARADVYNKAQTAYAGAVSNEAAAQLAAGSFHLELAHRGMARKVSLGHSGDAPAAEVDRATFDARAAEADVAAQAAHLAYLRTRESAVAHSIYLDAGANDVPYSLQRIDEIDLRLADIERARTERAAAVTALDMRLKAEERRLQHMSEADLDLSADGMVWKLGASNGERIEAGDTLAQVIDCGASFIVASIPQRQFSSVQVGSTARFRLSGETIDRAGRVLSITGDSSVSVDRNLAATPVADPAATVIVRIEAPPSSNDGAACLVGRTARVLLPSTHFGLFSWLPHWLT
jgi:multidrug resistance efflux pump